MYLNGNDTGSETFTRDAGSLSGDMAVGKTRVHYEARVATDGTIPRLDIRTSRSGADTPTPRRMTIIVGRDSTQVIEHSGRTADTMRLATPSGSLPLINPSMGLIEVVVGRARSQKSRTARIPVILIDALYLNSSPTTPLRTRAGAGAVDATFMPADTVRLSRFFSRLTPEDAKAQDQLRVSVGSDGRVRGAVSGADAKDHFSARATSNPQPPRQ